MRGAFTKACRTFLHCVVRHHDPKLLVHLSQLPVVFCLLLLLILGMLPFLVANVGTEAFRELFDAVVLLLDLLVVFEAVGIVGNLALGLLLSGHEVGVGNLASILQHVAVVLVCLALRVARGEYLLRRASYHVAFGSAV